MTHALKAFTRLALTLILTWWLALLLGVLTYWFATS